MRGIYRSDDVSLRKSPSISATVYPVGFKMRGNDGNMWQISRDSRGVQRWQKIKGGYDNSQTRSTTTQNWEEYVPKRGKHVKKEEKIEKPSKVKRNVRVIDEVEVEDISEKLQPKVIEKPKTEGIVTQKAKKAISGFRLLIEDDPDMSDEIKSVVQDKISGLEIFENDDPDVAYAAELYRSFLRESFAYGGKIKKIDQQRQMLINAIENTNSEIDRQVLEKKLLNLNEEKRFI